MGGPIFLPQCLRAVVLKGDGNKVLPPLQISSAFCVNGKSGLGRVAGALRHSTVTIAPLCSWGLQRNQAEEFGHSGLLQQWHRGGGWGLPSYVCGSWDLLVEVLQAPELAWSATGSCELDRSRISWLNCTYSSYSPQWIFSVWSSVSESCPETRLQSSVHVNSMGMPRCWGRWQHCEVWPCCDEHPRWWVRAWSSIPPPVCGTNPHSTHRAGFAPGKRLEWGICDT